MTILSYMHMIRMHWMSCYLGLTAKFAHSNFRDEDPRKRAISLTAFHVQQMVRWRKPERTQLFGWKSQLITDFVAEIKEHL